MERLALFVVLQLIDAYTTYLILKNGGRELNPFLSWLFNKLGYVQVLVVLKTVATRLVMRYLVGTTFAIGGTVLAGNTALLILCAFYAVIGLNNIYQIKKYNIPWW